ncbi:hypothetical protein [Neokomagataea anthophila]|uniref:Scaffolding protein n=1 Tax=Neokomagataea anthophila TaxID=2826925 RepID=A0ABS5E835_9PROT|nr:hypothetical protein [Neokomagataea anthophila]MBR0560057.1 hypothetical protein [Neokomagataea anthophila]
MSETLEATAPIEDTNILSGIEFGSDAGAEQQTPEPAQEPPSGATQEEAQAAPQEEKQKTPDWLQRKIDRATYERREAERQVQAYRDELEQTRRALEAARGKQREEPELTPDQIRQQERDAAAQQRAVEQEQNSFGEAAQKVASDLVGVHGADAVTQATKLLIDRGGMDFDNKSHQQIIKDISELPNSGAVYYALANDPDAASALFDAPERRQYALLQKFASSMTDQVQEQQAAPAATARPSVSPVSKAPPPVPAATGSARPSGGSRSLYDDSLSAEDFAKMFSKRG